MTGAPRFPPGRNVGTQLRALRARAAREQREREAAEGLAPGSSPAPARGRAPGADPAPVEGLAPGPLPAGVDAVRGPPRRARRPRAGPGATAPAPLQLALPSAEGWFAAQGWQPFAFQHEVWQHVAEGRSGLLHATTGSGKTYAVAFALLNLALQGRVAGGGLRLLWLTPMRALAADTGRALAAPLAALGLDWTVGVRTGDTPAGEKARQGQRLPEILVTTPESLSLMLTRPDATALLGGAALLVVDEWHELLGSKRGVQVQLALARMRAMRAAGASVLPVWGLSATLGNLDEAMAALLHPETGVRVQGRIDKGLVVDTLIPADPGRFPWGGHLGIQMLAPVVAEIERSGTTLVFTNVRSQAEVWYRALLEARPQWAGVLALHHGSLDREVREWVEAGLKAGRLKAVVATSSLDLGVDFLPVERVLQIGSAKGVARLMQRAGRSGHAPGRTSRVTLVPTHALELVEAAAARKAVAAGRVEARRAPVRPLDVLVQHLVTVALGEGFDAAALRDEVRRTWSYRDLTDAEWTWVLDFVSHGGRSLDAYPEYHRIAADATGRWRVPDAQVARRHRMSVGTITSDAMMAVKLMNGRNLGTVEEGFIARLRAGDSFVFGGRRLTLVRVRDMSAWVEIAKPGSGLIPRWNGSRMPFSSEMADALLVELEAAAAGRYDSAELASVRPLLDLQRRWSSLPTRRHLLVEAVRTREGHHLFMYPFAGRPAHIGLASLLALRVGRQQPATFSISVSDYGLELLTATPVDWRAVWRQAHDPAHGLLREEGLVDDVLASLNASELGSRRFREIARVAGLVFQGFPGAPRSMRQLQASSGLLYEVFRRHDAGNLLLTQADREVLEQELEIDRLRATLARLRGQSVLYRALTRPTPFAFPLLVARLREQLTTEKLADRVARMVAELERAAQGAGGTHEGDEGRAPPQDEGSA